MMKYHVWIPECARLQLRAIAFCKGETQQEVLSRLLEAEYEQVRSRFVLPPSDQLTDASFSTFAGKE